MAESLLKDEKSHRTKFESEQDVYCSYEVERLAESLKKIAEPLMLGSLIELRRHWMSQMKMYLESYNEDKNEWPWQPVSKKHYCEGDVLLHFIPGISHYGIYVGNDMVVHSVQDRSSGVNREQKLQYLNGPQMYTVKLDTIEDFESGEEVTTTTLTPPLFSIFWKRRNAKDIVKEALQKINTKSSLDSLAFVKHCTFMWRTHSIMIGVSALVLNVYFLFDTKRAHLFSTYVEKHYNKLIAFNISMSLFCTFLAYISYVPNSDQKKSSTDEKSKFRESVVDIEKKLPDSKKETYNRHFQMELITKLHKFHGSCEANSFHSEFISLKGFTLQLLPEGLREKDLYELIQVVAELTIRLCAHQISPNRPELDPNTNMLYHFNKQARNRNLRTGSGEIFALFHYINGHTSDVNPNILIPEIDFRDTDYKTCTCHMCQRSGNPSNEWYEIFATTSTVNVFDEIEAEHTTCRLFYDDDCRGPKLMIDKLSFVKADVETDFCVIKCVTCEKRLGEILQEFCARKNVLLKQTLEKYKNTKDRLCFIVSHPHGLAKHVTIGQWVENEKLLDYNENIDLTKLTYTTATCPGSAGASVYCVGMKHAHVHKGSSRSGLNYSGIGYYYKN